MSGDGFKINADVKVDGKDVVAGIGRLMETLEKGSGSLFQKSKIKRLADAEGYARIAKAETDRKVNKIARQDEIESITHEHEVARLSQINTAEIIGEFSSLTLDERTQVRIDHQETRKQENLEGVYGHAFAELKDVEEVPDETVDDDWMARFTNAASNISNEDMQGLWGRVLAGEIKKPGSFSLRAIECLRNLSRKEAETFENVVRVSFYVQPEQCGFIDFSLLDENSELQKSINLTSSDIRPLMDIGLIHPNSLEYNNTVEINGEKSVFSRGNQIITVKNNSNKEVKLRFPVSSLSSIGNELSRLVTDRGTLSDVYLSEIKKSIMIGNYLTGKNVSESEGVDLLLYVVPKDGKKPNDPGVNPRIL